MKDSEVIEVVKLLLPTCVVLKRAVIVAPSEEDLIAAKVEKVVQIHFSVKGFDGETFRLEQGIGINCGVDEMFKLITDYAWVANRICRDKLMSKFLATNERKINNVAIEAPGIIQ